MKLKHLLIKWKRTYYGHGGLLSSGPGLSDLGSPMWIDFKCLRQLNLFLNSIPQTRQLNLEGPRTPIIESKPEMHKLEIKRGNTFQNISIFKLSGCYSWTANVMVSGISFVFKNLSTSGTCDLIFLEMSWLDVPSAVAFVCEKFCAQRALEPFYWRVDRGGRDSHN